VVVVEEEEGLGLQSLKATKRTRTRRRNLQLLLPPHEMVAKVQWSQIMMKDQAAVFLQRKQVVAGVAASLLNRIYKR
jgi:hypothetical protein